MSWHISMLAPDIKKRHPEGTVRVASSPSGLLSPYLLALEGNISADEKENCCRYQAYNLRPSDHDAVPERQRRAHHRTLKLADVDRTKRPRGRMQECKHAFAKQRRGRYPGQHLTGDHLRCLVSICKKRLGDCRRQSWPDHADE